MDLWLFERPPGPIDLVQNNSLSKGLRLVLHGLMRLYLRVCHRYRAEGASALRERGPVLVVANHASHLDVAALFAAFPLSAVNSVRALAAKDYFFTSAFMRNVGFFVANAVPLDRRHLEASVVSCCRNVVATGGSLIVFPEGSRAADGRLGPFRPGVGMLAKALHVPVVPACIQGTFTCLRKGARWPRWHSIRVVFGDALDAASFEDSREGWVAITRQLERRVRQMSVSDA